MCIGFVVIAFSADVVFFFSLFQCRQCQDLLENNLANKRPIEGLIIAVRSWIYFSSFSSFLVMVGKKNLEVRPIAVNKGEIVKRILYMNPDTEFIFCAGDDKVSNPFFFRLHSEKLAADLIIVVYRPTKTCSARFSSSKTEVNTDKMANNHSHNNNNNH